MIPTQPMTDEIVAFPGSVPTPVLGLNVKDNLADMDARYALIMKNFFPEADRISVRRGYNKHATGMSGEINSLMAWRGVSGVKILATNDAAIYDVTSEGTATSLDTSITSGDWQDINITTPGGHFMLMLNGTDAPRSYDGSSISTPTITGSGLTASNLITGISHKERVWMIEKDSMNAWYLGTQAISGAASKFPMGAVFKEGGYLNAIGSYSSDSGSGQDDFLCFISSFGEVAIYQGTDPSSATTWSLVGRYRTGSPIGRRCMCNLGGDLLILTDGGITSVKAMIEYDRSQSEFASVSNKIDPLIIDAARAYKSNSGWQLIIHPRAKWLVVNIPATTGMSQYQYVMNTLTGAWCYFEGYNASSWCSSGNEIYFGGNSGIVYRADYGYQDDGAKIEASLKMAWNYMGARGILKKWEMIRPIISSGGTPEISIGIAIDFEDTEPSGTLTPTPTTNMFWDTGTWGSYGWGGINQITKTWAGLSKIGMCMSILLKIGTNGAGCSVNSFDIVAKPGGTL